MSDDVPPLPPEAKAAVEQRLFDAMLKEWEEAVDLAAQYKATENELRRQIFARSFPNPKEGMNRLPLLDGRTIKADYKINRKLEEATLPACLQAVKEYGAANADLLVRYKPELSITEWRALSDEAKLIFADAVIATPGLPTLEIETPKAKKGRK